MKIKCADKQIHVFTLNLTGKCWLCIFNFLYLLTMIRLALKAQFDILNKMEIWLDAIFTDPDPPSLAYLHAYTCIHNHHTSRKPPSKNPGYGPVNISWNFLFVFIPTHYNLLIITYNHLQSVNPLRNVIKKIKKNKQSSYDIMCTMRWDRSQSELNDIKKDINICVKLSH